MTEAFDPVELVREFHEAFGHPVRTEPMDSPPEAELRQALLEEELAELEEAIEADDLVEIADALGDIVYIAAGTVLVYGVQDNFTRWLTSYLAADRSIISGSGRRSSLRDHIRMLSNWDQSSPYSFPGLLAGVVTDCLGLAEYYDQMDLEAVFKEIHRSNMSKLGADGKPIHREDGKILKGPNYEPPRIAEVLGLQDTA